MGNIISFCFGYIVREIFEIWQNFQRENQENNQRLQANMPPPNNRNENEIFEIQNQPVEPDEPVEPVEPLQIEPARNENIPNPQNLSRYEQSRDQWFRRFQNPVYQSTRSRYRQVSPNAMEENHYQIM